MQKHLYPLNIVDTNYDALKFFSSALFFSNMWTIIPQNFGLKFLLFWYQDMLFSQEVNFLPRIEN